MLHHCTENDKCVQLYIIYQLLNRDSVNPKSRVKYPKIEYSLIFHPQYWDFYKLGGELKGHIMIFDPILYIFFSILYEQSSLEQSNSKVWANIIKRF